MTYIASPIAVILFLSFVGFVLGMSFYMGRKAKSAEGYFAAGGTIHWFVNGIAFAGDYLSAASFLGICGLIAAYGYDGFLYSIGYLAGWIVALFVVAEPMKRLGKYTFADALDAKFNSKGIQLMAAIGTLVVSMFYLIPQMVGAGSLVTPLLNLPHWVGVCIVGAVVVFIVATAGMTSTTYVQFLKGGLLIIFSTVICIYLFKFGFTLNPKNAKLEYHKFQTVEVANLPNSGFTKQTQLTFLKGKEILKDGVVNKDKEGGNIAGISLKDAKLFDEKDKEIPGTSLVTFVKLSRPEELKIGEKTETKEVSTWWVLKDGKLEETLSKTALPTKKETGFIAFIKRIFMGGNEKILYNGAPKEAAKFFQVGSIEKLPEGFKEKEPITPWEFIATIQKSTINLFPKVKFKDGENKVTVWYRNPTKGSKIMIPGMYFKKDGLWGKLNFISLMIALFFGTASLPHILIRYYTVPSQKDARKSTIVAIAAIGFFYILTMFMGLGAMTSGVMDVTDNNMAAPLLAKGINIIIFSIISAVAFATVLGTVSGLIVAASGAVAHDLMDNYMSIDFTEKGKVKAGKIAAIGVGIIAIILGIIFKGVNVSFLVGWAFAVAASANLPAIIMLLFWKRTTAKGIAWSIAVGMISAVAILAISPKMTSMYYDWWGVTFKAPLQLSQPGIISIPLAFITLIFVSLITSKTDFEKATDKAEADAAEAEKKED